MPCHEGWVASAELRDTDPVAAKCPGWAWVQRAGWELRPDWHLRVRELSFSVMVFRLGASKPAVVKARPEEGGLLWVVVRRASLANGWPEPQKAEWRGLQRVVPETGDGPTYVVRLFPDWGEGGIYYHI